MILHAENICKGYESAATRTEVLRGVSVTLDAGQSLALMGESGSGKSTLLHLIAGLDVPDRGTITLDGQIISNPSDTTRAELRRQLVGIIFQQFNLIPSLRVDANIAFQAHLAGRHDADWCASLADRMGLSEHLTKYPEALSGGQQQRVAIARALAAKPALILADEPTGNLDETNGAAIIDMLFGLREQHGATLIMVTHSNELAARCDRVIRLRDGRIDTQTVAAQ